MTWAPSKTWSPCITFLPGKDEYFSEYDCSEYRLVFSLFFDIRGILGNVIPLTGWRNPTVLVYSEYHFACSPPLDAVFLNVTRWKKRKYTYLRRELWFILKLSRILYFLYKYVI